MESDNTKEENLIISYLDKTLDKNEAAKVEQRMLKDEDFRNQVMEYKHAISGIIMHERKKISKIIDEISTSSSMGSETKSQDEKIIKLKTSKETKMENKVNRRSYIGIAASMIILLGAASLFFLNKNSDTDPAKLFAQHYNKEVGFLDKDIKTIAAKMLGTRGVDPKDTSTVVFLGERITSAEAAEKENARVALLTTGLKQFKKSDWTNSIITFNKYIENYEENSSDYNMALFYSAKSKLNDSHYLKAINDYEKFIRQSGIDKEMKFTAEWDRAIAYLVVDQSKVKTYLNDIAKDGGHKFQSEAKGLLEYLD